MVDNLLPTSENEPFVTLPHDDLVNILNGPMPYDSLGDYFPEPDLNHLDKPPTLDEVEGPHRFEVTLPGESSGKSSWIYSSALKKVFIKMNTPFTIAISYKNSEFIQQPSNLYLRIIPVFTEPEDHHVPVNRCKHHSSDINPHILACKNQAARHDGETSETNYGRRLCAIIPLSSRAPEVTDNITLEFYCQNSCATGINRRATALIFSLETEGKEIVGKRLMYFKVCSCPKRDKVKEEQILEQQRNGGVQSKRRPEDYLTPGNGKRPCKIIVKQEVKQEYSPPPQNQNVAQLSVTPMQMTPSYNEPLDTPGISYNLRVANQDALLQILKSAADIHCVMAADAPTENERQGLLYFRESLINEKDALELQIQQQQQHEPHHFQQQGNYMQ